MESGYGGQFDSGMNGECVVSVSGNYHIAGSRYFYPENVLNKSSPEIRDPPNFWKPPVKDGLGGKLYMDLGCPRFVNTIELVNMHNGDGRNTATKGFRVSVKKEESEDWNELVKKQLGDRHKDEDPLPIEYFYFPAQDVRFIEFEVLSVWEKNPGGLQYLNTSSTGEMEHYSRPWFQLSFV